MSPLDISTGLCRYLKKTRNRLQFEAMKKLLNVNQYDIMSLVIDPH